MELENTERTIDDTFIVSKTLGKGYSSKVVLAIHKDSGYKLAIKIFKPIRNMKLMLESFRKEVDAMKNLKHENLINVIAANESGIYDSPGKEKKNIMYIGIELAENAELFDFIADPGKGFSEPFARFYFTQLINGLKSMHDIKLAHRDLKTENLFLDDKFNLKIGDFGFAKYMDPHENHGKLKTILGTNGYQSPELLEGHHYSGEENDIFACGVILFILVNAYPPFREAKKNDNWYKYLYYEKYNEFWGTHAKRSKNMSKELKELITGMLKAKNRLTLSDILKSEWLDGNVPKQDEFMKEMNERKEKVDERRKRDALERLQLSNQESGGVIYRGDDDKGVIESLSKKLNEYNIDGFNAEKWDGHHTRYSLIFDGLEAKIAYLNFISFLVSENSVINLDEHNFSLEAEVPYLDESDGNEIKETLGFTAKLYLDFDSKTTVIELLKDSSSSAFSMKKYVENFISKTKK